MTHHSLIIDGSKELELGLCLSLKRRVPRPGNSRIFDLLNALHRHSVDATIVELWVDGKEAQ